MTLRPGESPWSPGDPDAASAARSGPDQSWNDPGQILDDLGGIPASLPTVVVEID